METSQEFTKVIAAVHNVQQGVATIAKNKTAKIPTRNGADYSYKYADLNDIWDAIKGMLKQEKLTIMQTQVLPKGIAGGDFFETCIFHESGEWVKAIAPLKVVRDDPQGAGSAVTFQRRYMLASMLGLMTDEDNDGRDNKRATGTHKAHIISELKRVFPEISTPEQIIQSLQTIIGKHPSQILESEYEGILAEIRAYTSKAVSED